MTASKSIFASGVLATMLVACAGSVAPIQSGSNFLSSSTRLHGSVVRSAPTLYVLNWESSKAVVSVYSGGGAKLLRSIDLGKTGVTYTATSFGGGQDGELYTSVSNHDSRGNAVAYTNKGEKEARRLHQRSAFSDLVVDASGDLFTTCGFVVCEYGSDTQQVQRKIPKVAGPLAVDASGNLAATACGDKHEFGVICVFAPGETQPFWTMRNGASDILHALMFDSSGNLYAAVAQGEIKVYAPNGTLPMRTITEGVSDPFALAFDANGNLYVLNNKSVTVYSPGATHPMRTITKGVVGAYMPGAGPAMALDDSGKVYVANAATRTPASDGSVTVYSASKNSPIRTVVQGVDNPVAIAIEP